MSDIDVALSDLPSSHRVVPPPLPPEIAAQAAAAPVHAPSSKRGVVFGLAFGVLLLLAIAGGAAVGGLFRRAPAPSPSASASAAAPPPDTAASTEPAPTGSVLTMPVFDLSAPSTPDAH